MHQTDNPEIYPYIWSKSIFDSGANYSVEEGESLFNKCWIEFIHGLTTQYIY